MSIEFRCTQCGRLLRVPAGSEGKKAKCPECAAVLTIPATTAPVAPAELPPAELAKAPLEAGGAFPPAEAGSSSENPYRSPYGMEPRVAVKGQIRPSRFDIGEALSLAWNIFKANFFLCSASGLIVVLLSSGTGMMLGMFQSRIPGYAYWTLYVALQVFGWWLTFGQMKFSLRLVQGEPASLADLFDAGSVLVVGLAVVIIYGLLTFVGFLLLIVPGVIVMLMLSQSLWLVVDQNAGIGEALQGSRTITVGNRLTLLALYFVLLGLFIPAVLFTCGLGVFFYQPFAALVLAVAYLLMTGQPVAEPRGELARAAA